MNNGILIERVSLMLYQHIVLIYLMDLYRYIYFCITTKINSKNVKNKYIFKKKRLFKINNIFKFLLKNLLIYYFTKETYFILCITQIKLIINCILCNTIKYCIYSSQRSTVEISLRKK